jgi:hypothetical protein
MFDTFLGFGDQVLSGIMLIVCAGISSHIMFGYGTRRGKETFIGLVLVLAVGVQVCVPRPPSPHNYAHLSCACLLHVDVSFDQRIDCYPDHEVLYVQPGLPEK